MREYVIMTDSCCDLTDHMAKELELTVVPLTVHIDGHDYPNLLDGSAISFEDFYGTIYGVVNYFDPSPAPSPPPTKVRASPPRT